MTIHKDPQTIVYAISYIDWAKAFGWGFITFPVVAYIVRVFGKQIWADIKTLWAKMFTKAQAEVVTLNG